MSAPRPWTVLPHGPIVELGNNLRAVEGTLPSGNLPRRMLIAKRADGRLLFYNAIPLAEGDMRSLEAFGTPSFLAVPNAFHRLDIHAFKQRYPGLQLLCPAAIRGQVQKTAPVNGDLTDFPADPLVNLVPVRGTKIGEPILVVRSTGATALGFGDLVMNIVQARGLDGLLFKLLGSIGGPRVTRIARLLMVADRAAVRAHPEELAALPDLTLLVPTHGQIIDHRAPEVLRGIALALSR